MISRVFFDTTKLEEKFETDSGISQGGAQRNAKNVD